MISVRRRCDGPGAPAVRDQALAVPLKRPARTGGLLSAMEQGIELVVSRSQIAKMQASKLSMPEGLEEGLTNQDLADLVDFIVADVH